ncbi:MAG: hypothetical protein IJC68_02210, partial [Firmicutes bacterium]|nr:hypothetical protein [Bacillota bacterium]
PGSTEAVMQVTHFDREPDEYLDELATQGYTVDKDARTAAKDTVQIYLYRAAGGILHELRVLDASALNSSLWSKIAKSFTLTNPEPVSIYPIYREGKPTIPEDHAVDAYYYDFFFVDRYDKRISDNFGFTFPENANLPRSVLKLFEKYSDPKATPKIGQQDSSALEPHKSKLYHYALPTGYIQILTDYYEPDSVEYLDAIFSSAPGTKTLRDVGVGDTEASLLSIYRENLYFIADSDTTLWGLDFAYDYLYLYQIFTYESNEIRDIQFFIKDGKVSGILMQMPFELTYVYTDREACLEEANRRRAELVKE